MRAPTRVRSGQPSRRAAFTLFEVLVALSLCGVLVAAVYSTFSIYGRFRTAGHAEVEQSQIARAIFNRIERDIRSVTFREEQEEPSSTDVEDAEIEEIVIETVDPADAYTGSEGALVGDSSSLVLHVSRPLKGLEYSAMLSGDQLTERGSDLLSVSYYLAGSGMSSLSQAAADQFADQADPESEVVGLVRLEGDRLQLGLADEQADVDTLAEQSQLLAVEVQDFVLRYFDGTDWVEEWDSTASGGLPLAVEIVLTFGAPSEETGTEPRIYRLVVPLAIAKPILDEF